MFRGSTLILKSSPLNTSLPVNATPHQPAPAPDPHAIQTLVSLFQQGRHAQVEPQALALTQQFPQHPFGWTMLAAVLRALKRTQEAVQPLRTAVALSPQDAQMAFNLGNALRDLGQNEAAAEAYEKAVALKPQMAQAHFNLGTVQQDLGRLAQSERSLRQAVLYAPAHAAAHSNLATTLQALGRRDEALKNYQRALKVEPHNPALHFNLADLLHDLGRLSEAQTACRQALQLDPDMANAHSLMGTILKDLGQINAALASYRKALALAPDNSDTQSSLLFCLNYAAVHQADVCWKEAQRFGQMVADKATMVFSQWHHVQPGQRLRIGFVSGDLREHPVGHFLEAVLAQLNSAALELIAFPTHPHSDALTERIRPHFSQWLPLVGLSDEAAAQLIHEQGIHLLLDLSGHTAHNRLPMFARRPAPVQASWLGYFATTGVAAIDYLMADPQTLPLTEQSAFTEKIWHLPRTRLCFTPPPFEVPVGPLPVLSSDGAKGYITFGCFSNLTKVGDEVVALWSRVLHSVPGSRLLLKAKQLKDEVVQRQTLKRFAQHGITPAQLMLEGPSARADYLAAYHRVDIGLDPFPFPGGTTTAESLWMGVPVLTLAGTHFLSRQGLGLLTNAGLSNWVARDTDDYLALAVQHARDVTALAQHRQGLRAQVLASPLFDAPQLARDLEVALQGMWAQTTQRRDAGSLAP